MTFGAEQNITGRKATFNADSSSLKNDTLPVDGVIETWLASIVRRLRHGGGFSDIHSTAINDLIKIRELPMSDVNKMVVALLRQEAFQHSQFLAFFHYYIIDGHYREISVVDFKHKLIEARSNYIGHWIAGGDECFHSLFDSAEIGDKFDE